MAWHWPTSPSFLIANIKRSDVSYDTARTDEMRLAIALIVLLTTLPSATSKAIADNNDDSKLLFSKDHQERWIIIRNLIFYSETTDNQIVLNQHHGGVMYKTKDQCISALLDIFEEQDLPWLAVKEPETILIYRNFSSRCFMVSLKEADE